MENTLPFCIINIEVIKQMRCFVFDLGGTLFEFAGMPYSWTDYYKKALITATEILSINLFF